MLQCFHAVYLSMFSSVRSCSRISSPKNGKFTQHLLNRHWWKVLSRCGLVLKRKKTTEKETQDGSGAIHVTGIPEIPSWFEKMLFTTSTHSQPYVPTSDGVHKNTFSFYPETWFISDELYGAILFCLYVLLTPKQIMTEFSFLIELFLWLQ